MSVAGIPLVYCAKAASPAVCIIIESSLPGRSARILLMSESFTGLQYIGRDHA